MFLQIFIWSFLQTLTFIVHFFIRRNRKFPSVNLFENCYSISRIEWSRCPERVDDFSSWRWLLWCLSYSNFYKIEDTLQSKGSGFFDFRFPYRNSKLRSSLVRASIERKNRFFGGVTEEDVSFKTGRGCLSFRTHTGNAEKTGGICRKISISDRNTDSYATNVLGNRSPFDSHTLLT